MYLRLNTQYNPFTYDELVKPLVDYGKAYKEAEDTYTTLSSQTESFKDMVNQNVNSEAYNMYKGYSDDLNKALDDFSKGMTSSNRAKLLELKKRYAGEIIPIARASQTLKEANEFRYKAGPDAIFKVNRYTSLDDFLHGKTADNSYVSAKQLAAQASAKALTVGPDLYREIRAGGDTPIITSIYDTLWKEAEGDSYDSVGKVQLHEAIMAGINSAAYKLELDDIEKQIKKDNQSRAWAQFRETQRMHDIELTERGYIKDANDNWVKKEKPTYIPVDLRGNPYNLDAVNEVYGTKEEHDKYAKFFDKDGNLTKDGLETYKHEQSIPMSGNISGTAGPTITYASDFAKFMTELTGKQNLTKEEIEKAYKENAKRFEAITSINADVIRNAAFHVAFRDNSHIEGIMKSIPNSSKLDTYEYTKEGYKKVGNINIHGEDFKDATYSGEYGSKGNFVVITTTDGKKYYVPLKAVHQALDASIQSTFKSINGLYLKNENGISIPYTDEELDELISPEDNFYTTRRDLIKKRINSALDNYIAAFEEMQTEPYKVTGGLH